MMFPNNTSEIQFFTRREFFLTVHRMCIDILRDTEMKFKTHKYTYLCGKLNNEGFSKKNEGFSKKKGLLGFSFRKPH